MGSRCGDLDPAVILHIMAKEGLSIHEANTMMNKHSGLYGISGVSEDMRELLAEQQAGNQRASLAIELFAYRLRKYIASYCGVLGRVDGLVFTGGIGENVPSIRALSCERLDFFGIELDPSKNEGTFPEDGVISSSGSRTKVCVIPTDEELLIARDTVRTVLSASRPS